MGEGGEPYLLIYTSILPLSLVPHFIYHQIMIYTFMGLVEALVEDFEYINHLPCFFLAMHFLNLLIVLQSNKTKDCETKKLEFITK